MHRALWIFQNNVVIGTKLWVSLLFSFSHLLCSLEDFVLGFYGPVNNEVMSSQSVNSGTVPGQA